jgi:hypothetical protein
MGTLRDLLEIYGSLDRAVAKSSSPAVASTVDGFLPGFSANTGWYDEVESFFFGGDARRNPDLGKALSRIGKASGGAAAGQPAPSQTSTQPGQGPVLTTPQKNRLLFGLTAAARAHQAAATNMTTMPDEFLMYAYIEAMAALQPADQPYDERLHKAGAQFKGFWEFVKSGCPGRNQFDSLRTYLANEDAPIIDKSTQAVHLCSAKVVIVDDLPVVVVDTNVSTPDRTFNEVTKIVNPFNWNENYPDFFISMDPCGEPERTDGWFRVLETVGFPGLGGLEITTALRYIPTPGTHTARVDYDLDDPTPGPGDGRVIVDRGFINIYVDNEANDPDEVGVRARTRKVVHIDGLSPYAQQRLVCLTGYGSASAEFLFGQPDGKPPWPRPFEYYTGDVPQADPDTGTPEMSTHVAATAVNLWTESVQGLASDYFDFAEKWMDGRLRVRDVADYSSQVTGRLVNAPLEFLERVSQPRYVRSRPGRGRPQSRSDSAETGGAE